MVSGLHAHILVLSKFKVSGHLEKQEMETEMETEMEN